MSSLTGLLVFPCLLLLPVSVIKQINTELYWKCIWFHIACISLNWQNESLLQHETSGYFKGTGWEVIPLCFVLKRLLFRHLANWIMPTITFIMPKITLNEELSQHRLPKTFYCDITTVSSRVQFKTVSLLIFIRKMRHIRNLSYYLHFPFCTKMSIILLCRRLKNDDSKQETRNSVKEYQSKACYLVNLGKKVKFLSHLGYQMLGFIWMI